MELPLEPPVEPPVCMILAVCHVAGIEEQAEAGLVDWALHVTSLIFKFMFIVTRLQMPGATGNPRKICIFIDFVGSCFDI